jgi:signal transduction histidine kinase
LTQPGDLSTANRQRLEVVHRNSLRLLKLVNTLLDFSRIEAGRIEVSFEPADLSALTTDIGPAGRILDQAFLTSVSIAPPALCADRRNHRG